MKIIGVNGSLSANSKTFKGIKAVLDTAQKQGAEVQMYDLREKPLPMYSPDDSYELTDQNVREFRQLLLEADGIVLGSPEYHGSMSGVFKNAMDWVSSEQFIDKPVALVSAAGGPTSMTTLTSMQVMIRNLYGWVVPTLGSIPGQTQFDKDGSFVEEGMRKRFNLMGEELVNMAELLKGKRAVKKG